VPQAWENQVREKKGWNRFLKRLTFSKYFMRLYEIVQMDFQQWFGSSQVTKNGQPLLVYRGGRNGRIPMHGRPIFFSEQISFARDFGEHIISAYLKAEKLYDPEKLTEIEIRKIESAIASKEIITLGNNPRQMLDSLTGIDGGVDWNMIESRSFQAWLRKNGYDGFVVYEPDSNDNYCRNFAVYQSDQVWLVNGKP